MSQPEAHFGRREDFDLVAGGEAVGGEEEVVVEEAKSGANGLNRAQHLPTTCPSGDDK